MTNNNQDAMDFYKLINLRHSVRGYHHEKLVEKEKLLRILEAGRVAPSAANKQPWTFMVVTSENMLGAIHQSYERDWFKQAPVVLVVKGRKTDAWSRQHDGYNSLETDLTIAMDHLILAATNEGLGTCWIANFNPAILHSALFLKPDEVVYAITPVGYPTTEPLTALPKNRKEISQIVEWV